MEPPDPLMELKYIDTEAVTGNIDFSLAPRRLWWPGELLLSFGFGGHQAIHFSWLGELNLLHVALKLGKMILLLAGPSQMAH